MQVLSSNERLAFLLAAMGGEVATATFDLMEPRRAAELKQLYRELQYEPPSREELEYVVDDFLKFFHMAVNSLGAASSSELRPDTPSEASPRKGEQRFTQITPSDDPVADLNRLDPYQISQAIGSDHPKTIALVLREIETSHAAKVLEILPAETRAATIVQLSCESTVPTAIARQVLKSTVNKACTITFRPETVDQSQALANLMRALNKQLRVELMDTLAAADADMAELVKSKLYIFSDIVRLTDRDVQKLLAQIETETLVVALQRCDQEIGDKLLSNLSKRARESIVEEMEFKQNVSDEEIELARRTIVETLAKLDESGEIKL